MPLLRLFVKTSEGENVPVDASDTDCIQDVKNHLNTQESIHQEEQILLFAGKMLSNEQLLTEIPIASNSTLTLLVRPSAVSVQSIDTLSLAITVPHQVNQGKSINLRLSTRDLVYHVKKRISKSTGFSLQHLGLCYQQNVMHNGRRLSHYFLPQTVNHIILQYLGPALSSTVSYRDPMNVFVRTLTGKTLNVLAFIEGTVDEFKAQIEEQEGIPAKQQRLIYEGKQLEDGRQLGDYNVGRDSTVHLVLRLLGGLRNAARCSTIHFKQKSNLVLG